MSKNFLVYKSSAGSGKTFILAKTYLQIALSKPQPEHFSQILAITFTVKAAAEMKERIIRYLSLLAHPTELGPDAQALKASLMKELKLSDEMLQSRSQELLTTILHNYGQFSVLTIDKFVNRLVRSFAAELGFTTDFDIELDVQRLALETVENLLEEAGAEPDISELLLSFLRYQIENDKSWKIETPLATLARHMASEEFYFQAQKLEGLSPSRVFKLKKEIEKRTAAFKQNIKELGQAALKLVGESGLTVDDFYRKKTGIIGYFQKAVDTDLTKLMTPNSYVLATVEEGKWSSKGENPNIEAIKGRLLDIYASLQEQLEEAPTIKFLEALSTSLFTLGLINELRVCFEQVKEDENVQLLSDFYQTISTNIILERAPFIHERIGNRFKHLLIDEFQDTSILQWQTFLPLIENGLGENHTSMVVGDVKQSIYRFRGGEPELFQSLKEDEEVLPGFLRQQINQQKLNENYRSSATIVDFNNRLFKLLTEAILTDNAAEIYSDFAQIPVKKDEGWIEVKLMHEDMENWSKQIQEWIQHNVSERGYRYSDICLLFHRNDHASQFATMLLEAGIPVVSDESLLLSNDPKIQAIIATLEAAYKGSDTFVLARWLAKLEQVEALKSSLHQTIQSVQAMRRKDFSRAAKIAEINLDERSLRSGTTYDQVLLVTRALKLDETDPFIRKLFDLTLEYEQTAKYLQIPFLQHWEEVGHKLSIDLTEGNAVRVMSIHKSKGLQFPIVILPLLGSKFTKLTNDRLWVNLEHTELELNTALLDTKSLRSTPFEELHDYELQKSQVDQLNVLYVALTRAEHKMYLMAKKPEGDKHWIEPPELASIAMLDEWNTETENLQIGNDRSR